MLFWSEAPFWGIGGYRGDGYWDCSAYPVTPSDTAAFEQSALRQLEEMIRIHRNHPSIVVWSMSNEPFFSESSTLPGVQRLLHRMVERTHQLDPTPLGCHRRGLSVHWAKTALTVLAIWLDTMVMELHSPIFSSLAFHRLWPNTVALPLTDRETMLQDGGP